MAPVGAGQPSSRNTHPCNWYFVNERRGGGAPRALQGSQARYEILTNDPCTGHRAQAERGVQKEPK